MPIPKATIIVPSRNKANLISQTLESIRAQDMGDFEVIVLDNNSTDGTREFVREYVKKDKRFSLIENGGDKGLVYSLNLGLSKAKGEYIAVLHCDDLWEKNFLSSSISLFEQNPSAGICICRFENIDEKSLPHKIAARNIFSSTRLALSEELFSNYVKRDFSPVCTVLVRKEAHEKCGQYDSQYPGPCDYQMWLKISHKFDGIFNADSTSKYRIYGENDSNTMIDENVILIEQYSMILKLFREYIEKGSPRQKYKKTMLRNTCLSSLRQAANAIAQGKSCVARSKCGVAIMCHDGFVEFAMAGALYFASWFGFILSPILRFAIPAFLPILKKLKLY